MSRFNSLALGEAVEAAELLGEDVTAPTTEELVAALINALRRIDRLESRAIRVEPITQHIASFSPETLRECERIAAEYEQEQK